MHSAGVMGIVLARGANNGDITRLAPNSRCVCAEFIRFSEWSFLCTQCLPDIWLWFACFPGRSRNGRGGSASSQAPDQPMAVLRCEGRVATFTGRGLHARPEDAKAAPPFANGSGRKAFCHHKGVPAPLIPARQPNDFGELVGQVELVPRLQVGVPVLVSLPEPAGEVEPV